MKLNHLLHLPLIDTSVLTSLVVPVEIAEITYLEHNNGDERFLLYVAGKSEIKGGSLVASLNINHDTTTLINPSLYSLDKIGRYALIRDMRKSSYGAQGLVVDFGQFDDPREYSGVLDNKIIRDKNPKW